LHPHPIGRSRTLLASEGQGGSAGSQAPRLASAAGAAGKRKAVDMNAEDAETFARMQALMSSSSDSMQEDEEEDAAPHASGEHHTGPWSQAMLADRLKKRKLSPAKEDQALSRETHARAQDASSGVLSKRGSC